jgi:transcriptional regulator with XRE-family HTH domain
MSTIHQIRAGRALLNWTQADLAEKSGLHVNAVNNAERGLSAPRGSSIEKMQSALEAGGVAFIGARGVELRHHAIEITKMDGADFLRRLTADILDACQGPGDDVIGMIADMQALAARGPAEDRYYRDEIAARGVTERLITADMPGFAPSAGIDVRLVPQHVLGAVDVLVYGDRAAFIVWPQQEAVVLKSRDLAFTQKMFLEELWAQGREATAQGDGQ